MRSQIARFPASVSVYTDMWSAVKPFVERTTAPYDAVVRTVNVAEGDRVAGGAVLVELED